MNKNKLFSILAAIAICGIAFWPAKSAVLTQQSNPSGLVIMVTGSTIAANGSLSISTAPSAALTAVPNIFINNTNGNVGIKTASPATDLVVNGTMTVANSLNFSNPGLDNGIQINGNNMFRSNSGGTVLEVNEGGWGTVNLRGNIKIGNTGTPLAVISTGTYTPTCSNTTNIDTCTPNATRFKRIGNSVEMDGSLTIDVTSSGSNTVARISLPIASNFADSDDAACTSSENTGLVGFAAYGDGTNDALTFQGAPATTASKTWWFHCEYTVK